MNYCFLLMLAAVQRTSFLFLATSQMTSSGLTALAGGGQVLTILSGQDQAGCLFSWHLKHSISLNGCCLLLLSIFAFTIWFLWLIRFLPTAFLSKAAHWRTTAGGWCNTLQVFVKRHESSASIIRISCHPWCSHSGALSRHLATTILHFPSPILIPVCCWKETSTILP